MRAAEGLNAVRAALMCQFEHFVVHRSLPGRTHIELIDQEVWIEPVVQEEATKGYTKSLRPILRRQGLEQAADFEYDALPL